MDITLHLGAHRTATTSFQGYLAQNRSALRPQGLEVWGPDRTRAGLMEGLLGRVECRTPETLRLAERSIGRMRMQQTILEQKGITRLVITDENLLGGMQPNVRARRLYPDARGRLALIRPAVEARCDRIVLSIRKYDTYWASVIGHRVLLGAPLPDEAALDGLITQPRRWRQVILDVVAVFPDVPIHVLVHERFAGRPRRQLAVLAPEITDPPHAHAQIWHNKGRNLTQIEGILADRRGDDSDIALGKSDQRWHPFTDLQTEALIAQYAEDLRWLRAGTDGRILLHEGRDETIDSQARRKSRERPGRESQADGRSSAIA